MFFPLMSFPISESNAGFCVALLWHVSLVSYALWQFLSVSLSFIILVFWRILLRHFVECLSVWDFVMFYRDCTAVMDYVERIRLRWSVLLLVLCGYVCVWHEGVGISPTTSNHGNCFPPSPLLTFSQVTQKWKGAIYFWACVLSLQNAFKIYSYCCMNQ